MSHSRHAETILATKRLEAWGCFEGYCALHTATGEEAGAIWFTDLVVMASGFSRARARLIEARYQVREAGNSVAAKLDGGMSCLPPRF